MRLAIAILLAASAQAATWYVKTTGAGGNDSSACTSTGTACATLNGAYQKASGGDIVEVAAGTYPGQTVNSKSPASDIIIRPASGASVTLNQLDVVDATHVEFQDMTVDGINVSGNANFVTFRRMTQTFAFFYTGGNNISMIGGSVGPAVDFHSQIAPVSGWGSNGNNFLFDGVLFHDFTRTDSSVHIECLQVAGTNGMIIRNSTFKNCAIFDLSFTTYNSAGQVTNLLLENNFFDTPTDINGTGTGSGAVHWTAVDSATVRFNSSTDYWWAGTEHGPIANGAFTFTGNNVVNGILDGDVGGCLDSSKATYRYNVTQNRAPCGANDSNSAPGFTDTTHSGLDLRLTAGATAINFVPTSVTGGCVAADIDGFSRPVSTACDAGASEFGGSGGGGGSTPTAGISGKASVGGKASLH